MTKTIILYAICEVIAILFMFLAEKNKEKKSKRVKYYLLISFLPFALLFIFRSNLVGKDFSIYAKTYLELISNTMTSAHAEWWSFGFKTICKFLSLFFRDNYYCVFAVINCFTLYLFYKTIWTQSEKPTISLLILFTFCIHFQIFNQFRQMLALAISFYSIKFLKEKNAPAFFITNICAGLIHTSALIVIPMYFIGKRKIDKKNLTLYLIIAAILFFSWDLIKYLLSFSYYGSTYFGSTYDVTEKSSIYNLAIRLIMLIICLILYPKKIKDNQNINYLYNNAIACTMLQIITTRSYIVARLTTYFYVYYILLIPIVFYEFVENKNKKWKIIYYTLFVLALIAYQIVYYYSSSGAIRGGYSIYRTIF